MGRGDEEMVIWMLSALIIAFSVSYISGKLYIPWLKKRGFVQPLKDEVNQIVYQADNSPDEHN